MEVILIQREKVIMRLDFHLTILWPLPFRGSESFFSELAGHAFLPKFYE